MLPVAFFGHGSPMNALEHNRYTDAWRAFGQSIERPRAALVVSAHWYTNATAVTAMARPRTIHDFYGFPDELFAFDYPARERRTSPLRWLRWSGPGGWVSTRTPGARSRHVGGAGASVPRGRRSRRAAVDQRLQPLDDHLDIGRRLAPLRDEGVLIVASGNVVHNLRRVAWDRPAEAFDWAQRFDDAARIVMQESPGDILRLAEHPDFSLAVPTPTTSSQCSMSPRFASVADSPPGTLVDGYTYGSISMISYELGVDAPPPGDAGPAAELPDPDVVPPDEANI